MAAEPCHAEVEITPKGRAKALILKTLGAKRVAEWCGVAEATVYQWLSRGTDSEPVPPSWVPLIVAGARSVDLEVDWGVLFPALRAAAANEEAAARENGE